MIPPALAEVRTSILGESRGTTEADIIRIIAIAVLLSLALLAGCTGADEPVRDARETLGTIVTVTAYGEDSESVQAAVDEAYDAMNAVEVALSVYTTESAPPAGTAAALNVSPDQWTALPVEAQTVLSRIDALDVAEQFSPTLYGVESLYGFGADGHVPEKRDIMAALGAASGFETRDGAEGLEARFATMTVAASWLERSEADGPPAPVGIDFGGAAKGLGLDRAAAALRSSGVVEAAVISAGSTTIAVGAKPDGELWRIGIENPRDPEAVISVVQAVGDVVVSTSGDYQRYFEADGVRYHHILDPESGMPALGTRSLTVVGTTSGLDSDILSTALFVMGPERARTYAEREGLGLYVIDDEGQALVTPGPDTSYSFEDTK